jgi:hypothetical protein
VSKELRVRGRLPLAQADGGVLGATEVNDPLSALADDLAASAIAKGVQQVAVESEVRSGPGTPARG